MRSQKTTAIILSVRNIGEKDKMVWLYSKEFGKLKTIAKRARNLKSKLIGSCQACNICEVDLYFSNSKIIIQEIEVIKSFIDLSSCLAKFKQANQILEITQKLTIEEQKIAGLFELIENCLEKISQNEHTIVPYFFLIQVMKLSGLMPELELDLEKNNRYLKLFNFLASKEIHQIPKIKLARNEQVIINSICNSWVENQTSQIIKSF